MEVMHDTAVTGGVAGDCEDIAGDGCLRIKNVRILTMVPGEEIFQGEIQIRNGCISYLGETTDQVVKQAGTVRWEREIDGEGNLVMPGFKNAHTHSPMTCLRSLADDLPLQQWLYQEIFPREAKLTGEDIYWCTCLAIMEYLTSGITANFDMYKEPYASRKAVIDTGFRTVFCGYLNDFCSSIEQSRQLYHEFNQEEGELSRVSFRLGFHAEYTTRRELLEELSGLAAELKAPVFAHLAETRAEVEGCRERHGMTPAVFLNHLGMFDFGGGGFHCVHMSQEDLEIFQEKRLWAVANPASNVKLASGIVPLVKMESMGIPLALGTDGPASNNCLDMFREMFLAVGLQKIAQEDAAAMDALRVLEMAVTGSAGAMGLTDCDVLAVGKCADLIMIDMKQPNMNPQHQICKNLVYSGSKQNVAMTIVAGKILYERGKFSIGVDAEEVYARVEQIQQ